MNVVNDYLDILQNIEFAIVAVYKARPELRDPDVILALEKLIAQYTREKKKLPPPAGDFARKEHGGFSGHPGSLRTTYG